MLRSGMNSRVPAGSDRPARPLRRRRRSVAAVAAVAFLSLMAAACADPPPATPGPAVAFRVTGLVDGPVGDFTVTVTAVDAAGEVATDYTGTVRFSAQCVRNIPVFGGVQNICINDPAKPATLPADYTFTAADAGVRTLPIVIRGANDASPLQWDVTATDAAAGSITGTQSVFVTPGPTTRLTATLGASSVDLAPGQLVPATSLFVEAFDQFGNYDYNLPSVNLLSVRISPTLLSADNTADLASNPSSITLTTGRKLVFVKPGASTVNGSVVTTAFTAQRPGITASASVTTRRIAPNLNPATQGGYAVQGSGSLIVYSFDSPSSPVVIPAGATFQVTSVDPTTNVLTAQQIGGLMTLTTTLGNPVTNDPTAGSATVAPNLGVVQTGTTITVSSPATSPFFDPSSIDPSQGGVSYTLDGKVYLAPLFNAASRLI